MLRTAFLAGLTAATTMATAPPGPPSPSASPAPDGSAGDGSGPKCEKNPILPYDKRLQFHDTALDGPDFDLAKYRGYAVWINIFATWCGPCRREQAMVVSKAEAYRDKGVRTIGLFANEQDDDVRGYRKKYAIGYPLVRDANGALTANLQGSSGKTVFPAHLFIDGTGHLYCYEVGGLDEDVVDNILAHLVTTTASPLPPDPEGRPSGSASSFVRTPSVRTLANRGIEG